ncbi:MAG: thiamine phosphate synthase, partial [Holosporales bacterium]
AKVILDILMRGHSSLPFILYMTDVHRAIPLPPPPLPGHKPQWIIVRHPDPQRRAQQTKTLRHACRHRRDVSVRPSLFPDSPPLLMAGHCPEAFWCRDPLRRRRAARHLLSFTVHHPRNARAAWALVRGVFLVSPVLPTASHPGGRPLGWMRARRLARILGKPCFALGGMHLKLLKKAKANGFVGVAGVKL